MDKKTAFQIVSQVCDRTPLQGLREARVLSEAMMVFEQLAFGLPNPVESPGGQPPTPPDELDATNKT